MVFLLIIWGLFDFFFFFLLFVFVLHVCLYEGVRSPGTTVIDICELPCGFWKLNQGPPEGQPVLLASEPSLQPPRGGCFSWCFPSSLAVIVFVSSFTVFLSPEGRGLIKTPYLGLSVPKTLILSLYSVWLWASLHLFPSVAGGSFCDDG